MSTAIKGKMSVSESSGKTALAVQTGNPDGKGASAFAVDWRRTEPGGVVAKPRPRILAEFFTSMLVLSAKFKFRPVPGESYSLYWFRGEWSLSLISPEQWSDERREGFAGTCSLQRDMTWTIDPSQLLHEDNPVSAAMGRFYEAFANTLDSDRVLEDILPFHVGSMSYYQRLYASGLSRSILASIKLGNQTETRSQAWRSLLPDQDNLLDYHD